jgi:hypothetical protein
MSEIKQYGSHPPHPPAGTPIWWKGEWWCWAGWLMDNKTGKPVYRPLFSQHCNSVFWSDMEGAEVADRLSPYEAYEEPTTTGEQGTT